ncbi:hypothetical protein BDV28DRAFT_157885 [Aspergillus coremiiformis]|uniref:Uncharacterized protein n=1 Tax=Aspergillus coremiiformis TaxID=138285 RepID=A0A5N6Z4R3_9EURO|nr:hypothetical protein BDV28DRAFT_157885 [Aspergillus coremiiformis]
MASTVKIVSTKLIAVLAIGARMVKVGYVEETDVWRRIHLSPETQQRFIETTGKYLSSLKAETDMVALQETPHGSDSDDRTHFTAVKINGQGTVVATRHFNFKS